MAGLGAYGGRGLPGRAAGNPCVQNVEARVPSLEEIFIAYMQQGREAGGGHPASEEAKP